MNKIEFIKKLSAVTDRPEADFAAIDPACGYLRAWEFYTTTGNLPTEAEAGIIAKISDYNWHHVLQAISQPPEPITLKIHALPKVAEPIKLKDLERFRHKSKYHD